MPLTLRRRTPIEPPTASAGGAGGTHRPDGDPSPLTTEHGATVGSPATVIPDAFHISRWDASGDPFPAGVSVERIVVASPNPDATPSNLERGTRGGTYLVIDGVVAAYGDELFHC